MWIRPNSCYYLAIFETMAMPSLQQNIKLRKRTAWGVMAIPVIGSAPLYFLRPRTKPPQPKTSQAVSRPQALLIESKGLPELSSENNTKTNSRTPEERKLTE